LSQRKLHIFTVTSPFFPPGVTLSIQCDDSGVNGWAARLPDIALSLSQPGQIDSAPTLPAKPLPAPLEVPEGIIAYAQSWNEEWAEADVLDRAKRLYMEHGNWEVAYQKLLEQDGEDKNG